MGSWATQTLAKILWGGILLWRPGVLIKTIPAPPTTFRVLFIIIIIISSSSSNSNIISSIMFIIIIISMIIIIIIYININSNIIWRYPSTQNAEFRLSESPSFGLATIVSWPNRPHMCVLCSNRNSGMLSVALLV